MAQLSVRDMGRSSLLCSSRSWVGAPRSQAISPGSSAAEPDSLQAGHTQGGHVVEAAQLGAQLAQQSPREHLSPPAHEMHAFPGSSNRLFDREPDNRHAEPVLLAQLAATQIRKMCQLGALSPCLLQQLTDWLFRISQVTGLTCFSGASMKQQLYFESSVACRTTLIHPSQGYKLAVCKPNGAPKAVCMSGSPHSQLKISPSCRTRYSAAAASTTQRTLNTILKASLHIAELFASSGVTIRCSHCQVRLLSKGVRKKALSRSGHLVSPDIERNAAGPGESCSQPSSPARVRAYVCCPANLHLPPCNVRAADKSAAGHSSSTTSLQRRSWRLCQLEYTSPAATSTSSSAEIFAGKLPVCRNLVAIILDLLLVNENHQRYASHQWQWCMVRMFWCNHKRISKLLPAPTEHAVLTCLVCG